MSNANTPIAEWSQVGDVAVVDVLHREILGPEAAKTFGEQLGMLLSSGQNRLLLDFSKTQIISSTAFGTLINFWKKVEAANGKLKICGMDSSVKIGADILGLGNYIPILDDRHDALKAFSEE